MNINFSQPRRILDFRSVRLADNTYSGKYEHDVTVVFSRYVRQEGIYPYSQAIYLRRYLVSQRLFIDF